MFNYYKLRSSSKRFESLNRKSQLSKIIAKENENKLSLYERKIKLKAANDLKVARAKLEIAKQHAELKSRNFMETQKIRELNKSAKDQKKYGHSSSQGISAYSNGNINQTTFMANDQLEVKILSGDDYLPVPEGLRSRLFQFVPIANILNYDSDKVFILFN